MPKVWNKRDTNCPNKNAVYVGRPSKWGNIFYLGRDGTREQVVALYRSYILARIRGPYWDRPLIEELRGKDLVCWCAPLPCHADVLLEVANA